MLNDNEMFINAINKITEKLSQELLTQFLKLPKDAQLNIVLIKSAQLLLANILCQVAQNKNELEEIANQQCIELKELIFDCAMTGFSQKFESNKH
jgi:hypothetical protein